MLSLIPLKYWLILGAVIGFIAAGTYEYWHLIDKGERICQGREVKAAKEQKARDDEAAKVDINDLNTAIARLRAGATADKHTVPSPRVRLPASGKVPAMGDASKATGAAPGPGGVCSLQGGAEEWSVPWAAVLDLTYSGGIEAAYRNAAVEAARKQGR